MKSSRGFALGLVLGVGIAFSGLAFAQNPADQNRKTDSCCAMECCKSDSCAMMKEGKKEGAKTSSDKHEGCCCCSGDSCDMKMKDMNMKDMKNMKKTP